MFRRLLVLPKKQSLFLFGARNTGKSTLLRHCFDGKNSLWLDLLQPSEEDQFLRNPELLISMVNALSDDVHYVVIDEIQKVPKLLDIVHSLIESSNKIFIMSGSSARKLKYGGANLLAGRAFIYHLYPLSFLELGSHFELNTALRFGTLPTISVLENDESRIKFLQAYALTYLKEEVWGEQIIRRYEPFRRFLEIAAQCNGKIINYKNISRDVGVDDKTIKSYFNILEDTLVGYLLEPFETSFRKRFSLKPKFYYFDLGVSRALARQLSIPLSPQTSAYGEAFEHFIILEAFKLASYYHSEFRFSYLRTKDDAEIDLIVERPGQPVLFIEIKSATEIKSGQLSTLRKLAKDFGDCEAVCFADIKRSIQLDDILVLPWREGLKKYFGGDK
ncbi:MAG: ATP-binding protein [Gammaproteobacteria bacterium]